MVELPASWESFYWSTKDVFLDGRNSRLGVLFGNPPVPTKELLLDVEQGAAVVCWEVDCPISVIFVSIKYCKLC